MFSKEMYALGAQPSVIREIFEYGKQRKAQIGAENVFDFSLGNPSVPAPPVVNETIKKLCDTMEPTMLHGYTSAIGDQGVRQAIADYLNRTHGTAFSAAEFYMTAGAAASLSITFKALSEQGDKIVLLAPFFPEYSVFAKSAGMTPVVVKCRESDLQLDFDALEQAFDENVKAIVVNSPNNPSGVVISEENILKLCAFLEEKQAQYGHPIFLISDEPYRELVYGDIQVPFLTKYYGNTIVCYSFSKSLSLPGDRIGYILVPKAADPTGEIYKAVCGAGRALGYVCAPSLFQFLVPACLGKTSDISIYQRNRDLLMKAFNEDGFSVAKPDGAFYLFLRSPEPDAAAFCERAKQFELLLVPSDSFGFPGYVRISYCVATEMIERSLPAFRALAQSYGLC